MSLNYAQMAWFAVTQPGAWKARQIASGERLPLRLIVESLGLSARATELVLREAKRLTDGAQPTTPPVPAQPAAQITSDARILSATISRHFRCCEKSRPSGDLIKSSSVQRDLAGGQSQAPQRDRPCASRMDGVSTARMYAAEIVNALLGRCAKSPERASCLSQLDV